MTDNTTEAGCTTPATGAVGSLVDQGVGRLVDERDDAAEHSLLERAAFAAGLVVESWTGWGGAWVYHRDAPANQDGEFPIFKWSPLDDDGDALRLAVKLRINFSDGELWRDHNDMTHYDPEAATRRVIVRAAADRARPKTPNGAGKQDGTVLRDGSA